MAILLRFIFGAAIGSFLNVIAVRYDPDRFILADKVIGGRSHCPKCGKTLRWFELVPVISWLLQSGRCRRCRTKLSFQYLLSELVCGAIFAWVPVLYASSPEIAAMWVAVMLVLFLISLIDFRTFIIPDELVLLLGAIGLLMTMYAGPGLAGRLLSGALSAAFFGLLVVLTRGRGMGLGDVKLAAAIGVVLGYPLSVVAFALSFIIGALVGTFLLFGGKKGLKSAVPFGPFLSVGTFLAFAWGAELLHWYLGIIFL